MSSVLYPHSSYSWTPTFWPCPPCYIHTRPTAEPQPFGHVLRNISTLVLQLNPILLAMSSVLYPHSSYSWTPTFWSCPPCYIRTRPTAEPQPFGHVLRVISTLVLQPNPNLLAMSSVLYPHSSYSRTPTFWPCPPCYIHTRPTAEPQPFGHVLRIISTLVLQLNPNLLVMSSVLYPHSSYSWTPTFWPCPPCYIHTRPTAEPQPFGHVLRVISTLVLQPNPNLLAMSSVLYPHSSYSWTPTFWPCPPHRRMRTLWLGGAEGLICPKFYTDNHKHPPPWTLPAWRHPPSQNLKSTPPLGHCLCDVIIHIPKGLICSFLWRFFLLALPEFHPLFARIFLGGGQLPPPCPPPHTPMVLRDISTLVLQLNPNLLAMSSVLYPHSSYSWTPTFWPCPPYYIHTRPTAEPQPFGHVLRVISTLVLQLNPNLLAMSSVLYPHSSYSWTPTFWPCPPYYIHTRPTAEPQPFGHVLRIISTLVLQLNPNLLAMSSVLYPHSSYSWTPTFWPCPPYYIYTRPTAEI